MNDLVTIHNSDLFVDSRMMADRLDVRHRDIMRDILDKYAPDFCEFGGFARHIAKPTGPNGGRPMPYYTLNEDQCYLLLTYIKNTPKARSIKKRLVRAFSEARAQIAQRDIARLDGKEVRRMETDSIKALVEYASANGSKSASRYFVSITKMTNALLGIESGQRDNLSAEELKQVSIVEGIVDLAIRDGLKAKMPYKDIYQLAKNRAQLVVPAIGRDA